MPKGIQITKFFQWQIAKKRNPNPNGHFFATLYFAIIEESLLQGYHFRLHTPIAFLTVAVADFSSYEKGKVR